MSFMVGYGFVIGTIQQRHRLLDAMGSGRLLERDSEGVWTILDTAWIGHHLGANGGDGGDRTVIPLGAYLGVDGTVIVGDPVESFTPMIGIPRHVDIGGVVGDVLAMRIQARPRVI